jgi:catechol 2,3-dioxygenase-like lactoylglutathione lyase family enzyme
MATVSVRYMVHDVEAAIAFYTGHLGFTVALHPSPGFAMLSRGNLRLLLNTPTGSGGAAQAMPDIVVGNGGKQILVDDPSGNPVELFEPRRE